MLCIICNVASLLGYYDHCTQECLTHGLTMNSLQSKSIKSLAWRQQMNCLFCCGPALSPFSVARVPVVVSAAPTSCSVWWLRQPAMTDPPKTPPPTHSLCPPKTLALNPKYQKYASSIERPVCACTWTAYVKISSIWYIQFINYLSIVFPAIELFIITFLH